MKALFGHLKAHPHLVVAVIVGSVVGTMAPDIKTMIGRWLLGWNVTVWVYLVWTFWTLLRADAAHVKRVAQAQAESAGVVLALVALAAVASFVAITLELSTAKAAGARHAVPHVLSTLSTVAGSWLLLPTMFSLNYAGLYHTSGDDRGLKFPEEESSFEPDYSDFLYFSFTIAVASQTADVVITNRPVRRLALLQSVLSFVFNTTILAFTVNIAASLF